MISKPLIYLAGPGVFRPDPEMYGANLKRMASAFGMEGLWPLDSEIKASTPIATAHAIRKANVSLIERCHGVIADISPFRGPNMDPGTAYEIGFADCMGKPVWAYSDDLRTLAERTRPEDLSANTSILEIVLTKRAEYLNGFLIEDFSLPENLMISCSVKGIYRSAQEAMLAAASELNPLPKMTVAK